MTERSIKVGDTVSLSFGFADRSGEGDYEIIRVMPARRAVSVTTGFEASTAAKGRSGTTRSSFHKQS